jgi:L-ascorbate 6-phosphate lactonase
MTTARTGERQVSEGIEGRFRGMEVAPGTLGCIWLGQAGYLLKTPGGIVVAIDPYLSEYALQQWGLPRAIPPAIDPNRLQPDLLLCSHWHEDHLDQPLIRQWAGKNPGVFGGPPSCTSRAMAWGWPADRTAPLALGQSTTLGDLTVTACFARHETPEAPATDAVSFLLRIDGLALWAICDTEYDARLRPMADERIDIAFTPINGVGGNLTDKEAALLLTYVRPKLAIPNHYNMWEPAGFGPGATLDPQAFVDCYRRFGGGAARILPVGEIVTLSV